MLRRRQAVLGRDLLVAELEGYIVAYCYVSQPPSRGDRFSGRGLNLRTPELSGQGVSLLGCRYLRVNVASVALYASLEFQQAGLLPEAGYKFGEWLRLLIMQRPLQLWIRRCECDRAHGFTSV